MTDQPLPEATSIPLEPEAPHRRPRRVATAVVAAVAVIAAGVFALVALGDDESNTPDQAVRALLSAAGNEDVLGVLQQLEPGERDAIRPGLTSIVAELNRLQVLDADLGDIAGVDLGFKDVKTSSSLVNDHVAHVRITGGNVDYRVDPAKLPLGAFVRDLLGADAKATEPASGAAPIQGGDDTEVVTVKRGDRWYVSIGYTIAEAARQDAHVGIDAIAHVAPAGAASPEAAVEAFAGAVSGLHLRTLIGLLPPDEMAALQEYAGLFLDDAETAMADARNAFQLQITDLKLRSEKDGDQATVYVDDAKVVAKADGTTVLSYADGCAVVQERKICKGDDPTAALHDSLAGNPMASLFGNLTLPKLDIGQPKVGIVTVQRDGKWFVSPIRTGLGAVTATLKVLDRSDLDAIRDWVTRLQQTFVQGMSSLDGN